MALKINDQFIPDWAVERQAQSFLNKLLNQCPESQERLFN